MVWFLCSETALRSEACAKTLNPRLKVETWGTLSLRR